LQCAFARQADATRTEKRAFLGPGARVRPLCELRFQASKGFARSASLYCLAVLRLASVGSSRGPGIASRGALAGALVCLAALAIGLLSAATTPLAVGGALFGLAALAMVWARPASGVLLFVALVALLPFGVIPVQVGVQLTLVDALMIATYSAVLVRAVFNTRQARVSDSHQAAPAHDQGQALARGGFNPRQTSLADTEGRAGFGTRQATSAGDEPLGRGAEGAIARGPASIGVAGSLLVGFVVVAVAAFGVGTAATSVPPELIRRFAKLVAALLFFLVVRGLIVGPEALYRLTRWLIVGGAIQGALGAVLLALPATTQLTLLTSLAPLGYPTTDVLRYVPGPNDTYTTQLRAIGTSIDPNVFGGTLMLALLLILVQWVAPRPVLPRSLLLLLGVPTLAGVILSLSRASWVGLAAGLLVVGVLRHRRILLLGVLGLVVLLALPAGQNLVLRFVSGFSVADPATAFRVGEYANALTLIQRYPLLGIGFGISPDIDVTAGVSSVYLLVAEQTGLLGLGLYVATLCLVVWTGVARLRQRRDPKLDGVVAAFLAAVSGALVAGLLDHYFANQVFPHAVALFWLYAGALASGGERTHAAPG
jgi:polysaccharide biosynthesis protein PslJ